MPDDIRLRKLQWLCRRGMKELDVLLEFFLQKNREDLNKGSHPKLEALLAHEDDQLWAWIQKTADPTEPEFIPLLNEIRRGA